MPVVVGRRRLGVERNGVFTAANTDPIAGGKLWPEAALTWNAMRLDYIREGGRPADFVPAGPNSSARSRSAQEWFYGHQPPAAARPGTSNHGWGIAVDVKTRAAAAWILKHGHRYGWSWDEGRRAGEWWHVRYIGASKAQLRRCRETVEQWRGYTASELRWICEYDRLRARRQRPKRRRTLQRVMRTQRKRLWHVAQPRSKGGDGRGWSHGRRRARYDSLLSRTR